MSLNQILSSAKSGLSAAQAGMQTVSNNISNVGVSGYARQTVALSTSVAGGKVNGVVVGEPSRVADKFLENSVYDRAGTAGETDAKSTYLDRLQSLFGATDSSSGISARLSAITSSVSAISGLSGSKTAIADFTGNIADTIDTIGALEDDVRKLQGDVESEVIDTVEQINTLLRKIDTLNTEVSRMQALGKSTSGVADERVTALETLSSLIGVTVRDQQDGTVTIETDTGQVLLDDRLRQLSYTSGAGSAQPTYDDIEIAFVAKDGSIGASTGDVISSSAVGGALGGLIDMRDRVLPEFNEQLGQLFTGLAQTLNKVSNEGTTLPPPNSLTGQANGLIGGDALNFTGAATFAVVGKDGMLVNSYTLDFATLGAGATVDDAVAAINAGLGGAATATFTDGVLSITATSGANGIAIAQDADNPSNRGGTGFSQFFGLNNIVRSDSSALVPSGFTAADPHGFAADQTAQVVLHGASGEVIAEYTLSGADGATWGDLVNALNASELGDHGTFELDDSGSVVFKAAASAAGSTIAIPSDSTDRHGTGIGFSALSGLTGTASGLGGASVTAAMLDDAARVPLAQLKTDAAIGENAIGASDLRNATAFVSALTGKTSFGKDGSATIDIFANGLLGGIGSQAARAASSHTDATARLSDVLDRRDSYAGVNIDEELANMVVLQNSYSAAARVMTTASAMYDTLLSIAD